VDKRYGKWRRHSLEVGVLDDNDGLVLSGDAGREQGTEVVASPLSETLNLGISFGLGMKLCSETTPFTTPDNAAEILGSLMLAMWRSPFTSRLWISVWKAART